MVIQEAMQPGTIVDAEFELLYLASTFEPVDVGGHCKGCTGCAGCKHLD